jgi:hypothetical protein
LLEYIIVPPDEDADSLRRFKYPYMSCEVFCCEIPDILLVFVEHDNGKFLNSLISFLDADGPLDNHLAGYFEKILEMLLRQMTTPVINFLNEGGTAILEKFLKHMDSYSIMQLVQRLMLPHIPFSMTADTDPMAPTSQSDQCNWSFLDETCDALCSRMVASTDSDTPLHISDLFITVLQLSPPEAPILVHICRESCLSQIFQAAFVDDVDVADINDVPTAKASISLAALSIAESILSRLTEIISSFNEDSISDYGDDIIQISLRLKSCTEAVCNHLLNHLTIIAAQLEKYSSMKPCGTLFCQSKKEVPRLGHRGLQLVKLVESMVRVGRSDLDAKLSETEVLSKTMGLIFSYEANSMLHLSIQRIALMIIEGGEDRRIIQNHIFVECGFLKRMMESLTKASAVDEATIASVRAPNLAHYSIIAQSIHHAVMSEGDTAALNAETAIERDQSAEATDDPSSATAGVEMNVGDENNPISANQEASSDPSPKPTFISIIDTGELRTVWDSFLDNVLIPLEEKSVTQSADLDKEKTDALAQQMEFAMQAMRLAAESEANNASWATQDDDDDDDDDDIDNAIHNMDRGQTDINDDMEDEEDVNNNDPFGSIVSGQSDKDLNVNSFANFVTEFPPDNTVSDSAITSGLDQVAPDQVLTNPNDIAPTTANVVGNDTDFADFEDMPINEAVTPVQTSQTNENAAFDVNFADFDSFPNPTTNPETATDQAASNATTTVQIADPFA